MTVLVLDDESALLAAIARMLRLHGHRVVAALRATEAAAATRVCVFDAVVADLSAGGLTRCGVVGAPLASRFVFISGGDLDEARKTGQPCLQKPFTYEQLEAAVVSVAVRR